jgi:hypothetical protein
MPSDQGLSTALLIRGHWTTGTHEQRRSRLNTLSTYEKRRQNLQRSLEILLEQYAKIVVAGEDPRFIHSEILAHQRILKTDFIIP